VVVALPAMAGAVITPIIISKDQGDLAGTSLLKTSNLSTILPRTARNSRGVHTLSVGPLATWSTRHAVSRSFSQLDPTPSRQADMAGPNQVEVWGPVSLGHPLYLGGWENKFWVNPLPPWCRGPKANRVIPLCPDFHKDIPRTITNCPPCWGGTSSAGSSTARRPDCSTATRGTWQSQSSGGSSHRWCGGRRTWPSGLLGHQYTP
jgi:hypothetical protein